MWDGLARIDPEERRADRLSMRAYVARYLHVDPHSWDAREVSELRAYFTEAVEIVKRENEPRRC